MKTENSLQSKIHTAEDGIVIPAILWWLGVPLSLVLLIWLVF